MVIDNYFNLGLLMGAVLSFLLSIYLLFYPNRFYPNRFLGALAMSWAITVFAFILQSPEFFSRFPHLYASPDVCTLLFFPLMYLYIRFYLYTDARMTPRTYLHFLPAIAYVICFIPFFILPGPEKAEMIQQNSLPGWFRPLQTAFNLIIILQGVFYSIFSLRMLHKFQYFRKRRMSKFQLESFQWLKTFTIINIILWVAGTTGVFLEIFGLSIFIDLFKVYYMGITILTILLSIFSIQRPQLFSEPEDLKDLLRRKTKQTASTPAYESVEDYTFFLNYLENEKPYLKTDLKMQDLVEETGYTYKRISEIFNNQFNKSFYDVMNEYRTMEAKELIRSNFHVNHTLNHLAEKAGFNSKATFNRTFKKYTGLTPSEFIKSVQ